jgi:putative MATE family efflux protein
LNVTNKSGGTARDSSAETNDKQPPPPVPTETGRTTGENLASQRMGHDWTKGNILKNLLLLSWPMAITQTLMSLGPTIDMIWVGKLGTMAIAAVGVSGVAVQLAQGAMMGLTQGVRALIARSIGAKDMATANRVAQQSIVVCITFSILMAIIGIFLAEEIVSLVTTNTEIINIGASYLRIQFIGSITMNFRMLMDVIMQGSGDSINPMQIAIVFRIIHIALCPFLIFGWWIFPELGVRGAAFTSVISQTIGIILGLRILFGNKSMVKLTFKGFHFDFGIMWRIIRIGFPSAIAGIQRSLSQFVLQIFIAPFGAIVLAAYTINQRIEMFFMMPAMSFGMGAGVLVGQNLGAKEPNRAQKSAWLAVFVVEIFVVIVCLALFIWTIPVVRIFNSDPIMDETARQFIHIAIIGWSVIGFNFVLMQALQGAGDTVPTMIISIVTTWLITMPLAYFLPKVTDWGFIGICWAMALSVVAGAVANVIYFRTGKWKIRRV